MLEHFVDKFILFYYIEGNFQEIYDLIYYQEIVNTVDQLHVFFILRTQNYQHPLLELLSVVQVIEQLKYGHQRSRNHYVFKLFMVMRELLHKLLMDMMVLYFLVVLMEL